MMTSIMTEEIIDWKAFAETRALMGSGFVRLLGYFREDGMKSVAAIESGFKERSSTALVIPAHTLKGEGWQFGATQLATLAEEIEFAARHYVEILQDPSDLVEKIVKLRPLFEATLAAFEKEVSPLVERRPISFGQRNMTASQFGRL
jgi:histidine phosphotransfer protein HptB